MGANDKQLNQYDAATDMDSDDVLYGEQDGVSKKFTKQVIIKDEEDIRASVDLDFQRLRNLFRYKSNLINADTSITGYYVNWASGNISSNESYDASDFIDVVESQDYYGDQDHYAFYNDKKEFISGSDSSGLMTAPSGALYLRVSYGTGADAYVVEGSSSSSYSSYRLLMDKLSIDTDQLPGVRLASTIINEFDTSFFSVGKNLFDKTETEDDKYINSGNGTLKDSSSYWVSGYIRVKPETQYVAEFLSHYAFYDINKVYISGANGNSSSFPLTSPENAYYFRISVGANKSKDTYQFEEGTSETSYEPFNVVLNLSAISEHLESYRLKANLIEALETAFLEQSKNLYLSETAESGKYVNWTNGATPSSASYSASDFIKINASTDYYNNTGSHYALYDEDKVFISGEQSGYSNLISTPSNAVYIKISIPNSANSPQLEQGTSETTYEKGALNLLNYIDTGESQKPEIVLPDKFIAVEGTKLQLFFHGMIKTSNPYKYNIVVDCNIGNTYERYYELEPSSGDVGNDDFTLSLYDDNDSLIASATTTIKTVDFVQSPSTQKNFLSIGDSLNNNGGDWGGKLADQVVSGTDIMAGLSAISNIDFIGEYGTAPKQYTGQGGWSWEDYNDEPDPSSADIWVYATHDKTSSDQQSLWDDSNSNQWQLETIEASRLKFKRFGHTASMPSAPDTLTYDSNGTNTSDIDYTATQAADLNPFWNDATDAVDFSNWFANKYPTKQSGGEGIDACFVMLGWNAAVYNKKEVSDWDATLALARTFLDNLHAEYASCKIYVMGLNYPSLNGGLGDDYGATSNYWSDQWSVIQSVNALNKAYQGLCNESAYSSFCNFVSISGQFDAENNMPSSDVAVNTRNTNTEPRGSNGIHPDGPGYFQISDAALRWIVKDFCQ